MVQIQLIVPHMGTGVTPCLFAMVTCFLNNTHTFIHIFSVYAVGPTDSLFELLLIFPQLYSVYLSLMHQIMEV